jgi:hypothetical protein
LSPIISVITKGDYADRPLPQIPGYGTPPPVPKRLAAQGVKPYTWPEFISDTMLPIPVEQAMNEVWHNSELAKNNKEANTLTKSFITAIVMGGTGGRLSDDWNKSSQPTQDPRIGTIITGGDGRKYRVASVDANGKLHGSPVP